MGRILNVENLLTADVENAALRTYKVMKVDTVPSATV
jgi:hypothetical protein